MDKTRASSSTSVMEPPTREEIKERVQDNFTAFVSDIDCYTLSDYLIQHRVLMREKWEQIQSTEPTDRRRNRALMNWLLDTNNPEAFPVLRDALDKENHWLVEVIDRPKKAVLSNDEIKSRIRENYEYFLTYIDAESVSVWLQIERVIAGDRWRQVLSKESTPKDKNSALLDCLFDSSDPNAFTVLRTALEKENHWLLFFVDKPFKSSSKVLPKLPAQDDLLAEIKQLEEENETLRQKLEETQETLRQEKERTQCIKRTQKLGMSQKCMTRNNQLLESLIGEVKRVGSLPSCFRYDSAMSCTRVDLNGLRLFEGKQGSSTTITTERSHRPWVAAEQKSDQSVNNINNKVKEQRLVTLQLDLHQKQRDPLIVQIPETKILLPTIRTGASERDGRLIICGTTKSTSKT